MAYAIHITKKNTWSDKEPTITQAEWDSLQAKGILESAPNYPPELYAKQGNVFYYYHHGDIVCKPPDDAYIQKIKEVASVIGAKVQGDEGEFY